MRLYAFSGRAPNFGDDLNPWLFPRLLPDFFDGGSEALFLGIGSILFDSHPPAARKIVFGSGDGGYTRSPVLDASWDVRFVRGPLTAARIGLAPAMGLGDSAILLATLGLTRTPVQGRRIYIPHVDSACDGSWRQVADAAGLRYVDPRQGVDDILHEILSAELVITEAMHGAIVADTLRVPWVAMQPLFRVHWPKWDDWGAALGLQPRLHALPPSTPLEWLLRSVEGRRDTMRTLRWRFRRQAALGATVFRHNAAAALQRAASAEPQLSDQATLEHAAEQMMAHVEVLRRTHHS